MTPFLWFYGLTYIQISKQEILILKDKDSYFLANERHFREEIS